MKIHCSNLEEFYNTIYELTTRGLLYNAYVNKLEIELTGGY